MNKFTSLCFFTNLKIKAFGVFCGLEMSLAGCYMRDGDWRLRLTFSPAKILLLFLACLWLLFTIYATGSSGSADLPHRRLFDISQALYPDSTPGELQALSDNLADLKERGCLRTVGSLQNGTGNAYDLKMSCIQTSFMTRVLPQMAMVLIVFFSMLVLGSFVLRRLLK